MDKLIKDDRVIKAKELLAMFGNHQRDSLMALLTDLKRELQKQKAEVREAEKQIKECEKALGLKKEWSVS